ncbi:MAG TPA: hypothetical protein VHP81_09195, partial [Lachnospiraceae bacterium]|nr:hypothetical protein [Lachnospiraceae bacterium]
VILLTVIMLMTVVFSGCTKKSDKDSSEVYKKGTVTDTTFESKFLNLKFTLPENFTMVSEEELDSYIQFAADTMYSDEGKTMLDYAKATVVYEIMARNDIGSNVNIVVEKLRGSNKDLSIDEYIEVAKKSIASTGMTYTFDESTTKETLAGNEYTRLNATVEANGASLTQSLYFNKIGDRMMLMSFTYTPDSEADFQTMKDAFTSYK